MTKKKILILYDYFDPAYKAGGPIRSLVNLVGLMEEVFDFYILTSNCDHDGSLLHIEKDKWVNYGKSSQVHYMSGKQRGLSSIKKIILDLDPEVVYLNGIFSLSFVLFPLWVLRKVVNTKIVIAPRGMLQSGALQIKLFKKKLYLKIFHYLLTLQSGVKWHATDGQEVLDVQKNDMSSPIQTAGNIPKYDLPFSNSDIYKFDFVSISLLAVKKNHLAFIKALKHIKTNKQITYHIFGPVTDQAYFNDLQKEMAKLPQNIKVEYKGALHPSEVSNILKKYKFYVLTSFGENFGHSIFEAFNQGIPVLIGNQTPWSGLYQKKAGWDVDVNNNYEIQSAIEQALSMNTKAYLEFKKGARTQAENYMNVNDFEADYQRLFNFD